MKVSRTLIENFESTPNAKFHIRFIKPLSFVAVVAILIGAVILINANRRISVPDLNSATSESGAVGVLSKMHFESKIVELNSDSVKAGDLIQQTPQAGTRVKRGSLVTLSYSKGPLMVEVPALVNVSLDTAKSLLTSRHLSVGKIQRIPSEYAKDLVVHSDPASNTLVKHGSSVALTVSNGHYGPCTNVYPGFDITEPFYNSYAETNQGYEAGIIDFLNNVDVGQGTYFPQRSETVNDPSAIVPYLMVKSFVGAWKMDNGLAVTNTGVIDRRTWNAMRAACK